MSRNLSAAASRTGRLARSTHIPDGFRRGQSHTEEITDTAGDAIFTPEPRPEVEDKWSRLATAIEAVEHHALVKKYGFTVDSLITAVDSDHPMAMGFEVLAITLAACNAADELADMAGPLEVCKVLGWIGPTPPSLKAFGADRLFKGAAALQARIEQIRAERARPAPVAKVGGIRPRLTLPTRTSSQAPAQQTHRAPQPITPELRARIEGGMVKADRLGSPGARQVLGQALATTHSKERAERLVADAERMLRNCEATAHPAPATRASTPTTQQSRPAPRVGKTERDRLKKLVRAGKMSSAEYETKTGYQL